MHQDYLCECPPLSPLLVTALLIVYIYSLVQTAAQ